MTTSGSQDCSATWLKAHHWFCPFLMPAVAAVAAAVYSGALASSLEPWARALLVGSGPLLLHLVLPLADWVVGERLEPDPLDKSPPSDDLAARLLPAAAVLAHFATALYAYAAVATSPLQPGLMVLLALTLGASGATSMAASHELVHSRHPLHLGAAAAFLTAYWWYPYYRAHLQHHLHVCTPVDYSCAGKGLGVYEYMGRYLTGSYVEAWELEVHKCERTGKNPISLDNSTLVGFVAQALVTAGIWLAFGPAATSVHLGCCALLLLYISLFDYVLHYGLYRPPLSNNDRRFTPVTQYNSWNSFYPFENALLFNVLCHSDHHIQGAKSYRWLRPPGRVPTFPFPVNMFAFAALVPPLWRAVMDPRVDKANAHNGTYLAQLSAATPAAPPPDSAVVTKAPPAGTDVPPPVEMMTVGQHAAAPPGQAGTPLRWDCSGNMVFDKESGVDQ